MGKIMSIYLFLIMLLTAVSVVYTHPSTEDTTSAGRVRKIKEKKYIKVDFKSKP